MSRTVTIGAVAALAAGGAVVAALLLAGTGDPPRGGSPATPEGTATRAAFAEPDSPSDAPRSDGGLREEAPVPTPAGRRLATGVAASLRVEVVDPWDRPVRPAQVVATPVGGEGEERRCSMRTAGPGHLELSLGVPYRLVAVADAPWFAEAVQEPVRADAGSVRFTLPGRGLRVSGTIRRIGEIGEKRRALVGWTVLDDGGSAGEEWCVGGFDLLVPGERARLEALDLGWTASEYVAGRPGEWIRDLDLVLQATVLADVRGRVVDSLGSPVRRAFVWIHYVWGVDRGLSGSRNLQSVAATRTDDAGRFAFDSIAPGTYRLRATAAGFATRSPLLLAVEEPRHEVEIVLARSGRVRLRLIDPEGGSPTGGRIYVNVPNARDIAGAAGSGWSRPETPGEVSTLRVEQLSRDEEGYLVLDELPPGALVLRYSDGTLRGATTIDLSEGETATVDLPVQ